MNITWKARLICSAIAASVAFASAPASAQRYYYYDGYDHAHHRPYPRYYGRPRTVYVEPAPTYYAPPPAYYAPAPATVRTVCRDNYDPLPFLLGGAAGGIAGSTIGKGHGRTAAIISGAIIGGTLLNST